MMGYAWLGYEEAMARLTYENAREMLRWGWEILEKGKGSGVLGCKGSRGKVGD